MGRISAEEKLIAVKRRLEGGESFEAIGNSMGVHRERIREWCGKYQSMGSDAFVRTKNNKYTLEFKITAVEYYLQGKDPCMTHAENSKFQRKKTYGVGLRCIIVMS